MPRTLIQSFGDRLRERIKAAGFSSLKDLLLKIGIGESWITSLRRGGQKDAGILKVAQLAIMTGRKPSELMAELDDLLLNPEPIDVEMFSELGLPGRLADYDPFRLAIVVDVVLGWDEELNKSLDRAGLAEQIATLYEEMVRPNRSIEHLQLRRRATAFLFEVDLPEPEPRTKPRGRGRPPSSAAA